MTKLHVAATPIPIPAAAVIRDVSVEFAVLVEVADFVVLGIEKGVEVEIEVIEDDAEFVFSEEDIKCVVRVEEEAMFNMAFDVRVGSNEEVVLSPVEDAIEEGVTWSTVKETVADDEKGVENTLLVAMAEEDCDLEAVDETAHVFTVSAAEFKYWNVSVSTPNQLPALEKEKWHVNGD